jgi:3D (Asp-Asp-Asp) domain-containing protein
MTKGHINLLIAGSCAILIGWVILMVLFPNLVFINTDEPEEFVTDTVEIDFSVSTSEFDTEVEYKPTPETKSLKTAENESGSIAEETTTETEITETAEETTIIEEETTIAEQYLPLDRYLGEFLLTAYCPCSYCCGKSDGITATGTVATAGRTIAVDPRVIPYGSQVEINGHIYTAEDCGGAIKGNRVDFFFDTHEEALKFGRQEFTIWVKEDTK